MPYGKYILKFDEKILGNGFELAQNDIEIELTDGMESFYHTFFILEKKRKVINKKFGPDGKVIETEEESSGSHNNSTNGFGNSTADNGDNSNNNSKQNGNTNSKTAFEPKGNDQDPV